MTDDTTFLNDDQQSQFVVDVDMRTVSAETFRLDPKWLSFSPIILRSMERNFVFMNYLFECNAPKLCMQENYKMIVIDLISPSDKLTTSRFRGMELEFRNSSVGTYFT